MEINRLVNKAPPGAAQELAWGDPQIAESPAAGTNSPSPSDTPATSSASGGSHPPDDKVLVRANCMHSETKGVEAVAAEESLVDQAGEPLPKRQRCGSVVAEGSLSEAEPSTGVVPGASISSTAVEEGSLFEAEPSTGAVPAPSTSSSSKANESRFLKQEQHVQLLEPAGPIGCSTASLPKKSNEENASRVPTGSQGDASSGLPTAANAAPHSEEHRGGISLNVFFGPGGEEDFDLDSLLLMQNQTPTSGDPPLPSSQADDAVGASQISSASADAEGSPRRDISAAGAPAPQEAAAATGGAVEAGAARATPSPVDASDAAHESAASPNEGPGGPHMAQDGGSANGLLESRTDAASSAEAAASSEATDAREPVAGFDATAADGTSPPAVSSGLDSNSSINYIPNDSSAAANTRSSEGSVSSVHAGPVDSSADDPNSSSAPSAGVAPMVDLGNNVNEVIDLSNIEVVDSDDGAEVPVVDVETEALCLDSAVPSSSESSSGGHQNGGAQRPAAGSPTAVVLDSDDDDVVELRCRQRAPFTVNEFNNYMLRHPMAYQPPVVGGYAAISTVSAHLRHRLLQEEMAQRREEDDASSNPALPRCPICLKRYKQQQQEEEASKPEQASDGKGESHSQAAGEPVSGSQPDMPTNTSTGQNNWEPPPRPSPPLLPLLGSGESDKDHVVALKCGHVFCKGCIQVALRTRRQCPVCRVVLRGSRPYQRIFL